MLDVPILNTLPHHHNLVVSYATLIDYGRQQGYNNILT